MLNIGVDYFKELQRSEKPSNSSVYTGAAGPDLQEGMMHVEEFSKAAFGSSIFIIIVSPMTIVANSLLLVTFLVDPLKIFRNPTSYFLIGLAIVDLLTALIQEPIYATCFMLMYFQHPSWTKCESWMKFAAYFSAFPISISASIVFAFTLTQYIVVASPLRYGRMITKKKALLSVVAMYLYHTLFCCLPLMGVPQKTKHAIDLFFHRYTVVLVTIVVYIILWYTLLHHEKENDRKALTPKREGKTRSGAAKLCPYKCRSSHYYDHVFRAFSSTDDNQIFSGRHIYCSVWDTGSRCEFDDGQPALPEISV